MRDLAGTCLIAVFVTLVAGMYGLTQPDVGLAQGLIIAPLELGLLVILVRMSPGGSQPIAWLVATAALLRIAAAVVFQYLPEVERIFALDAAVYDAGGQEWANHWKGYSDSVASRFAMPYYRLVGVHYFILGHAVVVPKITNAILGAATVFYTYRIGIFLAGEEAGWRAARLVTFFPSLILWSAMGIRDALAILAIVAVVWHTISLKLRFTLPSAVMLLAALMMIGTLREYMFPLMGCAVVLGIFLTDLRSAPRNLIAVAILACLLLLIYRQTSIGEKFVSQASLADIQRMRDGGAIGARTAYMTDVDISTPQGALLFLPLGIAYFLFSPFPWQIGGIRHLLPLPEMLYWYSLIPVIFFAMRRLLKDNFQVAIVVLVSTIVLTVSYGLGSSNVGTAYRHRGQVMPLLLAVAAAGLTLQENERRRLRQSQERAPQFGGTFPGTADALGGS